jgi:hypothetical protein
MLSLMNAKREALVQSATDIAFAGGDTPLPRADVEQMIRACVAIAEEGLVGQSREIRAGFLEALPDVARSTTWDLTVKNGVPCWTIIMGQMVCGIPGEDQPAAIHWFSRFIGEWWADVSRAMLPVLVAENRL